MLARLPEEPHLIAGDIRDYKDLLAAFRKRAEQIGAPREEYDRVIGWADGLGSKLLSDRPLKFLGRKTLGPLLLVMGIKLQLVLDPPAVEKYTRRLAPREGAGNSVLAIEKRRTKRRYASRANSEWGRKMRAAQLLRQSAPARKRIARAAARARWKRAP
jgi:hypothetical protein